MNSTDIQGVKAAAAISMQIMREVVDAVRPGVSTLELDQLAAALCAKHQARPAFKGVVQSAGPFPGNICVSINDVVLHAIPAATDIIQSGDLVKVDFGLEYKGYFADHCVCVGVGELKSQDRSLLQVTKLAVETGVAQAIAGNTTGDIGHAIQTMVELAGFNVVKEFIGHGIGNKLHLNPEIPAYGYPGEGDELQADTVICVEAQIVAGQDDIYIEPDGWTVRTADGAKAAMFEYMVLVTQNAPQILTDTRSWNASN